MSTRIQTILSVLVFAVFAGSIRAGDAGYEERRYAVSSLNKRPENNRNGETSFDVQNFPDLGIKEIGTVLRTFVAPDSWNGEGRVDGGDGVVTVVQKKEAHADIEKVLQWLQEGVMPNMRATVVTVSLKTETIRKLSAMGTIPAAELLKVVEEAGEGNSESVELNGVEGQLVLVQSGQKQSYLKDYDVSGAVFDPVISGINDGLSISLAGYRSPDCKSVQLDLSLRLASSVEMKKGKLELFNLAGDISVGKSKSAPTDEQGNPTSPAPKRVRVEHVAEQQYELGIDLPVQTAGGLQTSLTAPQGAFVLAGTVDFSLAKSAPGNVTAVFVRANIGSGSVPTLKDVSGLKEGESVRLYPIAGAGRTLPPFPRADDGGYVLPRNTATGESICFPGPGVSGQIRQAIDNARIQLNRDAGENQTIEELGPVLMARLPEAAHARVFKQFADASDSQMASTAVHAIALALPQAAYRKLLFAGEKAFDLAGIDALSGNGASVLVDTQLNLTAGQAVNTYAGEQRAVMWDYEISGDSYDPVIRSISNQAYSIEFKCQRALGGHSVEARFFAVPAKAAVERAVIDTFTVNSGAQENVTMGLRADIDKVKMGTVNIRSSGISPSGKFILAGSAHMPAGPDGKADARQAVLFVQAK